jgi:hypothetical protein
VSGYTRQEVAQRAGVDPDYVDRLVELGILTPAAGAAFSRGDALRAVGYRALSGPACARRGRCRCPGWRALVLLCLQLATADAIIAAELELLAIVCARHLLRGGLTCGPILMPSNIP